MMLRALESPERAHILLTELPRVAFDRKNVVAVLLSKFVISLHL
jgi:hypothetical protein